MDILITIITSVEKGIFGNTKKNPINLMNRVSQGIDTLVEEERRGQQWQSQRYIQQTTTKMYFTLL